MGVARKNFSRFPISTGHRWSWHFRASMTKTNPHKPVEAATKEPGATALAALVKAIAQAAARADFAAERDSGHEQRDEDMRHE